MKSLCVHHYFYDKSGNPVGEGFLFPNNVYFFAPLGDPAFRVSSVSGFVRYVKKQSWVLGKPFPASSVLSSLPSC